MPAYGWLPDFTQPVPLTGLVIEQSLTTASLIATVDASADTFHESYVWEAQTEDGDWAEVDRTTDPELDYRLAKINVATRLRVRDWNGAADPTGYSDPVEAEATLALDFDWMVHLDGDDTFTRELRYAQLGPVIEKGLDQVILDPLSAPEGEVSFPIVITGQRRAERVSFGIDVLIDDDDLIRILERASRLPSGSIAIKTRRGRVFAVQLGSLRLVDTSEVHSHIDVTAVRVA